MKVLLINPPFYRWLHSHNNDAKLSLGYLSAILTRAGYEVIQYNADYESTNEYPTQKDLFDKYLGVKESGDPNHIVYEQIYKTIDDVNPDIVGLTITSGSVDAAEIIAAYCNDKDIHVIVGGPMVTLAIEEMLKIDSFNQFIIGEGERVIKRAIENPHIRVINSVPPINLDTLPFPQYDNYYGDTKFLNFNGLITARGCPYRCKFCAHFLMGSALRFRTPDNVIKEVKYLYNIGIRHIRFFDDTFTLKYKRVIEICNLIKNLNYDNLTFTIETRPERLNNKIISLLKEAGCTRVKIGVESGSQRIIDYYRGGHYTLDDVRKTIGLLKQYEINNTINILFGFPCETNKELQMTIDFIKELKPSYVTISALSPYFGTELFYNLPKYKQKSWKYFHHNTKIPIMNQNLSSELIEELLNINDISSWSNEFNINNRKTD